MQKPNKLKVVERQNEIVVAQPQSFANVDLNKIDPEYLTSSVLMPERAFANSMNEGRVEDAIVGMVQVQGGMTPYEAFERLRPYTPVDGRHSLVVNDGTGRLVLSRGKSRDACEIFLDCLTKRREEIELLLVYDTLPELIAKATTAKRPIRVACDLRVAGDLRPGRVIKPEDIEIVQESYSARAKKAA